jgi:hypothetical protein
MKVKPTKEELRNYLNRGYSLRHISRETDFSVPYLSKLCKKYGLPIPSIGRPKGYKMSEESKEKISQARKEL